MSQAPLDLLFGGGSAATEGTMIRGLNGPLPLHADESLPSLLARISSAKHLDDPTWICAAVGVENGFGGLWTDEQASRMAKLLGLPRAEIAARAYVKTGGAHSFLKTTVARQHIGWGRFKICPCCIAEKGYHSAVFDLHAMRCCPHHAVALIDRCGGCGARITFRGTDLFVCRHCRTDFRTMETNPIDTRHLACEAFVAKCAGFPEAYLDTDLASLDPSPAFADLSLGDHLHMMQTLGLQKIALEENVKLRSIRLASNEGYQAMQEGRDLMRQWPDRFFDFLDKVSDSKSNEDGLAYGARSTFKPLYDFLASANAPHWRKVKRAFEVYLRDHWQGVATASRRNARIEVAQPTLFTRFQSAHEVQRRSHFKAAELAALTLSGVVKSIVVPPRAGLGKAACLFIDRETLDAIAPPGKPLCNLKSASEKLGLSIALTKRLADAKALPLVDGPSISGAKRYLFAAGDLEAFVSRLTAHTQRRTTRPERTFTLTVLLKRQAASGIPVNYVVDAIATGEIESLLIGPMPITLLWNVVFRQDEVDQWFRRHRALESPDTMSRSETMAFLGVNKVTVTSLVEAEWLLERSSRGRYSPIDRASVEAFKEQWTKLGEIAESFGTSRGLVRIVLDRAGVRSIKRLAKDDRDITAFYDRAQVERLDIEHLCRNAYLHKGKSWSEYASGLAERRIALQPAAA
jgi:TniQ